MGTANDPNREELVDRLSRVDVDVDRTGPAWRALPADAEAVVRIVREAREIERAPRLVPTGAGSRLAVARPDLGLSGAVADSLLIDTSRMAGIIEYVPGDGTLTARAGTRWGDLQETVREGGFELTPDVAPSPPGRPETARSTLGGIIAGGLFGLSTKLVFDAFWADWSAAIPWSAALGFAFILCVVGIIGDLVESLLKRDAKVKDTGALLPGMGGVLDRIDAPLLGLPTMYYLLLGYVFFQVA